MTRYARTSQTATALLDGMGLPATARPPVATRPGMPSKPALLGAYLDELAASEPHDDALLVVHGPTQDCVDAYLDGARFAVPKKNRAAAFRLERTDDGWRCTAAWPGSPAV